MNHNVSNVGQPHTSQSIEKKKKKKWEKINTDKPIDSLTPANAIYSDSLTLIQLWFFCI